MGRQREWATSAADDVAVVRVMAAAGCPRGIAQLLVARGFTQEADVKAFFSPTLNDLIDPMQMLGMAAAVERIQRAVRDCEPILIYGDYDVDGTTATVLLKTAIERTAPKDRPAQVRYHVPHRIREGYGMQTGVLADAAAAGVRLVISVDTGIRAFAAATEAKALGLDLIVTDHHLPDDAQGVPEAVAVINPAQPGCGYPFKSLCGAAVAFKLAHAILRSGVRERCGPRPFGTDSRSIVSQAGRHRDDCGFGSAGGRKSGNCLARSARTEESGTSRAASSDGGSPDSQWTARQRPPK